jgi:hypothetical protein
MCGKKGREHEAGELSNFGIWSAMKAAAAECTRRGGRFSEHSFSPMRPCRGSVMKFGSEILDKRKSKKYLMGLNVRTVNK